MTASVSAGSVTGPTQARGIAAHGIGVVQGGAHVLWARRCRWWCRRFLDALVVTRAYPGSRWCCRFLGANRHTSGYVQVQHCQWGYPVFACFGLAWCHHSMQLTFGWLCMVSPSDGACSRLFVSSVWGHRVDAVYSVWLCMVPPLDGWPLFHLTWCHPCDEAVLFECA